MEGEEAGVRQREEAVTWFSGWDNNLSHLILTQGCLLWLRCSEGLCGCSRALQRQFAGVLSDSFWFGDFCSPPVLSTGEDLTAFSKMSFSPESSHKIPGQVGSPDVNTPWRKGWGEFCWRGQNCVC